MVYQNPIYQMFNQNNIQEQLKIQQEQQHYTDQMLKSLDCAKKLDDFLQSIDKVEPNYRQVAFNECCIVFAKYMEKHGQL